MDTAVELAKRKPEALLESMAKVNARKNLVIQLPALRLVRQWVRNAKSLKRAGEY